MPSRPARSHVGDLIRTRPRALNLTLADVARKIEDSVSGDRGWTVPREGMPP